MEDMHIRSIALVAALKMAGFTPISAKRDTAGRTDFVFARTQELIAAMDAYRDDTMTVAPRLFAQAQFDVKTTYLPFSH